MQKLLSTWKQQRNVITKTSKGAAKLSMPKVINFPLSRNIASSWQPEEEDDKKILDKISPAEGCKAPQFSAISTILNIKRPRQTWERQKEALLYIPQSSWFWLLCTYVRTFSLCKLNQGHRLIMIRTKYFDNNLHDGEMQKSMQVRPGIFNLVKKTLCRVTSITTVDIFVKSKRSFNL